MGLFLTSALSKSSNSEHCRKILRIRFQENDEIIFLKICLKKVRKALNSLHLWQLHDVQGLYSRINYGKIFIQTLGIQQPADLEDRTCKTFLLVRETVCSSLLQSIHYPPVLYCALQELFTQHWPQRQYRKTKPAPPQGSKGSKIRLWPPYNVSATPLMFGRFQNLSKIKSCL